MSDPDSLPRILADVRQREDVLDTLNRLVAGIDDNDFEMFSSACYPDMIYERCVPNSSNPKDVSQGLQLYKTRVFDIIGPMPTMHYLTNIRIDVDVARNLPTIGRWYSANLAQDVVQVATVTANLLAARHHLPAEEGQHPSTEQGGRLGGSKCYFELIKDHFGSGKWKITKWSATVIWAEADPSLFEKPTLRRG